MCGRALDLSHMLLFKGVQEDVSGRLPDSGECTSSQMRRDVEGKGRFRRDRVCCGQRWGLGAKARVCRWLGQEPEY
jgi:hypothetical protein